ATRELLVVRRVASRLGDDVPALETAHRGRGDLSGEKGVLAQRLRGASPERRAEDVDGRAEEDVEPLRDRLVADRDTEAVRERGVPRRGEDLGIRERGARRRAVADAVRSVSRRQRR